MFRFSSSIFNKSQQIQFQKYVPKFRCPVCHAGKFFKLDSTCDEKVWLTGTALDAHLSQDLVSHWKLRKSAIEKKIQRNDQKEHGEKVSSPFFSPQKYERELRMALLALPNSSLVDRYLIVDSSNVQMLSFGLSGTSSTSEKNNAASNANPEALEEVDDGKLPSSSLSTKFSHSIIREIDLLWRAFQQERICVIFIQEHLLGYSTKHAPIFSVLGALAEGSANVHDHHCDRADNETALSSAVVPLWRSRGYQFRLLGGFGDEHGKKSPNFDFQDLGSEQTENIFRPWNSVVVPTNRGAETGDFAIFETAVTLNRMLEKDEERFADWCISSKSNNESDHLDHEFFADPSSSISRRARFAEQESDGVTETKSTPKKMARIDVVTADKELSEAIEAALLGDGRLTVHFKMEEFAQAVLRGD